MRLLQAQSRRNLCVWYSIHKTEQPFIFEIEGQVQDIEKSNNVTEVLVQEDSTAGADGVVGYQLDDNLVRSQPIFVLAIKAATPMNYAAPVLGHSCHAADSIAGTWCPHDVPQQRFLVCICLACWAWLWQGHACIRAGVLCLLDGEW